MRPLRSDDRTILVRADGDAEIGTGHVMRCLALAQAWSKGGGDACFASAQITPSLEQRLLEEKIVTSKIEAGIGGEKDAAQTIDLARQRDRELKPLALRASKSNMLWLAISLISAIIFIVGGFLCCDPVGLPSRPLS